MTDTESIAERNMIETYLNLEKIDVNIFRSQRLTGFRQVYGGQVIGQAMVAAGKTVMADFHLHSLHCYFIKKGRVDIPILYLVDRVRDGRTFCTRYVQAVQDGIKIFACELSFQKEEPHYVKYQPPMPDVPPPEALSDVASLIRTYMQDQSTNDCEKKALKKRFGNTDPTEGWSIDIRPVNPEKYLQIRQSNGWDPKETPRLYTWVKSRSKIGDDPRLQHCAAAYISDMFMMTTAMQPVRANGVRLGMTLSLDHSMWFHQYRFRMDDWVLFETESPAGASSRAIIFGRMYTRDGELILSCAQEGLIRAKL